MLLSCLIFVTNLTRPYQTYQLSFILSVHRTYMIGHVIVRSSLCNKQHPIQQVSIFQFHFQYKPNLYDQSRCYPDQFLSQTAPGPISHKSSISFSTQTIPLQSVKSLSYLVFVRDHTRFDRLQQPSFIFGVDHTFTINHIIVLSSFYHKPHLVQSTTTTQFHFWNRRAYTTDHVIALFCLIINLTQSDRS